MLDVKQPMYYVREWGIRSIFYPKAGDPWLFIRGKFYLDKECTQVHPYGLAYTNFIEYVGDDNIVQPRCEALVMLMEPPQKETLDVLTSMGTDWQQLKYTKLQQYNKFKPSCDYWRDSIYNASLVQRSMCDVLNSGQISHEEQLYLDQFKAKPKNNKRELYMVGDDFYLNDDHFIHKNKEGVFVPVFIYE